MTTKVISGTGILLSVSSGLFAALAAAVAKKTFSSQDGSETETTAAAAEEDNYESLFTFERLSLLAIFIFCNVLMWLALTAAFHHSKTTGTVSVLNTASNLLFSGAIGWLCYSETITIQWLLGISFILLGVSVILTEK